MNRVTYVSNAGVFIQLGEKKILIDGLCGREVALYKSIPDKLRDKILFSQPPFDGIDLILYTHHHNDHFEPKATAELLRQSPNSILVSTSETVKRLYQEDPGLDGKRVIVPDLEAGEMKSFDLEGISLHVISMIHEGAAYRDVENFAFLIEAEGKRVMHVGDAKPMEENYAGLGLLDKSLDLILVPFPYVGVAYGQLVIQNMIQPKEIAALHLPKPERDQFNWIAATKKSFERVKGKLPKTVFLESPGDFVEID